ncbi:MAG: fatty acid desaturase family protein [Silvanigrellaceae bacterium]
MREQGISTDMTQSVSTGAANDLPGSALAKVVADLQKMQPGPGLLRLFCSTSLLVLSLVLSWQFNTSEFGYYAFALMAGVFFAASAVTTHDAIHHTLTGWEWFDEVSARVVTWPVLWPHGLYSELHKLHHKMNGVDLRDPERVTYTESEYESAGPLMRFYIRNQLWISVLFAGGIGMIAGHIGRAIKFLPQSKALRRQMTYDIVGIVLLNGMLYAFAAYHGQLGKAVLLYLLVERVGGGLLQFRAHIEHYGLSGKRANYFATQLHTCRNIETNAAMSWLMNGLNFHSIHHAFPKVPFYHLEEATRRMDALLDENSADAMPHAQGYLRTYLSLSRKMRLLNDKPQPSFQKPTPVTE